jgi:hypothetical protein
MTKIEIVDHIHQQKDELGFLRDQAVGISPFHRNRSFIRVAASSHS